MLAPTAGGVSPRVATIGRLWDDAAWLESHQDRAAASARRWDPGVLAGAYRSFFELHARRT